MANIGEVGDALSEEEEAYIARAADKRQKEFSAGRSAAKAILRDYGVKCASIPASSGRYPLWPPGFVGSISHTESHVLVAVGASDDYCGLGVDIEKINSVEADLYESLFTHAEREFLQKSDDVNIATTLFSCKESVYKAVFPMCHEFLEFTDVEIELTERQYSARCVSAKESAELIQKGRGLIDSTAGNMATIFLIQA